MIGATERQKISAESRVLPSPYDSPPQPEAIRPSAATLSLVKSQIGALLTASPSFHSLNDDEQRRLSENLVKIAAYSAELIRDDWYQSTQKIGQTPIVRKKEIIETPVAAAQATKDDNFNTSAANQIGRVTKETLNAIAFPTFVADLIKGTFNAIVQSSIQQMEAYTKLIENVSKTVDQFMQENISDNQAKDFLAQMYPEHIEVKGGNAVPRDGADEKPAPNFQADLNLSNSVSLDESAIEEVLVPAARRKLAQSRHQMLATMVMMGINRIVITGGKIRATMGFHIDATDKLHQEKATDFDFRAAASGSFGFGPWSVSASTSVSYVTSSRQTSDSELNVEADLTGEVEIHFKSDYFPLERFANSGAIGRIQSHTAVPESNAPTANAVAQSAPFSEPPAIGGDIGAYKSPRTNRSAPVAPSYKPIGTPLDPPKLPEKVLEQDKLHVAPPKKTEETKTEEKHETKTDGEKKDGASAEKPAGEAGESADKSGEKKAEPDAEKEDGLKEKASKAIGEVGDSVKQAIGDKAGGLIKDVAGSVGK